MAKRLVASSGLQTSVTDWGTMKFGEGDEKFVCIGNRQQQERNGLVDIATKHRVPLLDTSDNNAGDRSE